MPEFGEVNVVKAAALEKTGLWLYVHVRQTSIMEVAQSAQHGGNAVTCAAWGVGLSQVVV